MKWYTLAQKKPKFTAYGKLSDTFSAHEILVWVADCENGRFDKGYAVKFSDGTIELRANNHNGYTITHWANVHKPRTR